jgi:uncharacterized protein (DUF58 family)
MAIILEQKKKTNWFGITVSVVLLVTILVGGYFLFFAPTPGIEVVAPLQFQSAVDLAKITFDPSAVVNSRQFKSLKIYTGLPSAGALGRENPFKAY